MSERGVRAARAGARYQSTLPHLASFPYTWAYQLPGQTLFDSVETIAHVEFSIFLFTLAGIPVLVRWMIPGARASVTWAATFLFSGILLYDSSLSNAADHIAASWAIPIYLALRRALHALDAGSCAVLAVVMAGAALTKYQAAEILTFPAIAIVARAAWLTASGRRPKGLGVLAVLVSALTAPHWLKNWLWYGDPIYPFLHERLAVRP